MKPVQRRALQTDPEGLSPDDTMWTVLGSNPPEPLHAFSYTSRENPLRLSQLELGSGTQGIQADTSETGREGCREGVGGGERPTSNHGARVEAPVLLTPIGCDPGPLRQEARGGRPHIDDLGRGRPEYPVVTGTAWPPTPCLPSPSPPPAAAVPGSRCGAGSHARPPPPRGICKARARVV